MNTTPNPSLSSLKPCSTKGSSQVERGIRLKYRTEKLILIVHARVTHARATRKRISTKLQNPRLNRISFHTFRHWKATQEYHKTKNILYVMELLGHRDIKTTMFYTHLVDFHDDQYHVAIARTLEEDKNLLAEGWEFVTERDTIKIYRKPK